ncbi:MAG: hypothetical protein R2731_11155 [Nocardioides sp.]
MRVVHVSECYLLPPGCIEVHLDARLTWHQAAAGEDVEVVDAHPAGGTGARACFATVTARPSAARSPAPTARPRPRRGRCEVRRLLDEQPPTCCTRTCRC